MIIKKINYKEILVSHHIQPSNYRIKVLECLSHYEEHPTAEQLFQSLSEVFPTVSKMSVYNTIEILLQAGLIKRIALDNNEVRYDSMLENHGHFKCESCGKIFNFEIEMERLAYSGLDQFKIEHRDVFFKGICPICNHS